MTSLVVALALVGQASAAPQLVGQTLADALRAIEARGIQIVFTDDLVRPEMRVREEPKSTSLRDIVDEVLKPHGLTTRPRDDGALIVVLRFEDAVDVAAPEVKPPPVRVATEVPAIQVRQTPGGLENVFHTLQLLPGVTATSEFGSRQSVRGGGPDENLIVMDDIELHNPYRLFGLVSGINPDTVDHFDLFAGAFSAKYGDRLSSMLQIDTRDGRSDKAIRASANVSITDTNVIFEGRLPHAKRGSWLVTTRRTYYDLLLGRASSDVKRLPMFSDGQAKIVWEPAPRWRAVAHLLVSHENSDVGSNPTGGDREEDFDGKLTASTRTTMLAFTLDRTLARQAHLRSTLSVSRLSDAFDLKTGECIGGLRPNIPDPPDLCIHPPAIGHAVRVRDWTLRETFSTRFGSRHEIETGVQARGARNTLSVSATGDDFPAITLPGLGMLGVGHLPWHVDNSAFESAVDGGAAAAWLEDHVELSRALTLVPGVRLDYLSATGETLVSPRVAATLALGGATRLKASAGVHYQGPGYDKAFLGGAAFAVDLASPQARGLRSERAAQVVAGIEHDLSHETSVRIEAYTRRLDRLIVGRLETETERARRLAAYQPGFAAEGLTGEIPVDPLITMVPSNEGSGRVDGLELFLEKKPGSPSARLSGWLSYTLSKADRTAHGVTYPFDYDRRHAAAAIAEYRISPRLTARASLQMASGLPVTLPLTARVAGFAIENESGSTLYYPASANGGPIFTLDYGPMGRMNGGRLPASSRIDARVTWGSETGSGHWTFYVDVINVTNKRNKTAVFSELRYNPDGPRPIVANVTGGGFPILPTAGVRWRF